MSGGGQRGFSLIELLVTVAIIGIIATIAIPNFQRFVSQSEQAEAKTSLAAAYTAEQTFQNDFQTYTYCLYEAGYDLSGSTRRHYTVGFLDGAITATYLATINADGVTACNFGTIPWGTSFRNDGMFPGNVFVNPAAAFSDNGTYKVTSSTFKVVAFGSISGSPTADAWSIDQGKNLTNVQSGL